MKFIGDEKTARFVLAKVQEAKPARDEQLTHDPFEGKDTSDLPPKMVASCRASFERMRKEGHPIDISIRDESLVVFGFPEVTLGDHEKKTVSLAPGIPFDGSRLFIIPESLGTANVHDFLVGRNTQLFVSHTGPVPVEMFAPLDLVGMHIDRAFPYRPISLTLSNDGSEPHTIRAAIFGRQATPEEKPMIDSTKRAELYATLRKQLDTPANHKLLTHLETITALEADFPGTRRIPVSLVRSPNHVIPGEILTEGETGIFVAALGTDVRVTHLVLTEEAARHFDMQDFKIGKGSQLLTSESIPFDFFSVEHNQKSLAKVSALRGDKCYADQIIGVFVRRRVDGHGPQAFTGLLWVELDQ